MVAHLGANSHAQEQTSAGTALVHVSEVFGIAFELLFDAVHRGDPVLDIPLWNGLRLQALAVAPAQETQTLHADPHSSGRNRMPLKDIEAALIRRAVDQARGNVAQAAQALGISRATVYRKLGQKSQKID
jgi:DNA-binding NtrC family response regulator